MTAVRLSIVFTNEYGLKSVIKDYRKHTMTRPPLPPDRAYTLTIQIEAGYQDDRVVYYAYLVTDGVIEYDLLGNNTPAGFTPLAAMGTLLQLMNEKGITLE
jgi:hypothetical protein